MVRLLDLPLGDGLETRPLLFVAAAGASEGWRRAVLSASYDSRRELAGCRRHRGAGGDGRGAGRAAGGGLGARSIRDRRSRSSCSARRCGWRGGATTLLVGGANLAAVGDELIQFGAVEALGDRRFRLSRLLRGRRGTEMRRRATSAGEPFTLIAREALVAVEAPAGSAGGEARILASGVGDVEAAAAARAIDAAVLRPPSPVHLAARETGGGDLAISWVRRSRQGWAWVSGADTPLGEEAERYRLAITGPGFRAERGPDRRRPISTPPPNGPRTAPARFRFRFRRSAASPPRGPRCWIIA